MATESVKVLKVDTGQAQTSVKDLRTQLKQLKDTMLSCEQGTDEYNAAVQQAAEIQHTLKEQMEEVNASAMDFGQIVGNCTKAVGGMVAGFQAAKAVMNLFGIENEEVVKSLQKMQSLMAITQALPAIDNSVKAFKRLALAIKSSSTALQGFSKAAVATGLGAIVVALGLLIANWDKVTDAMKKWGIIHEDTKKKLDEQRKKVEELRGEIAKLEGDYENWEKTNKISKLNSEAKKSYDALTNSIVGLQKQLDIVVAKQKLPENQSRANWTALQKEGQALLDNITQLKNQQNAILANADSYKELAKTADDAAKKQKELAIDLYETTRKLSPQSLQEELEQKFRDNPITIPIKIELDEEEELSIDDEKFLAKADELRKNVENVVDGLRKAFITPEQQYAEEQHALELALNARLISEQEYYRLSKALAKEHADYQKTIAIQEAQVWMSALGNIGSVFASMADMIDTSTEEGEQKYKALMYTSTVISMLAGIGGAIASAFNPANSYLTIFGQIAMAATTSASVLASGIAQLSQIKNANQNSSLGGAFGTPSTNAITNLIAPVQYTQDVQGANIEGAIRDSKVYVTETDITNTQNRVKVAENEARF
jgi:hypothetical protein